MLGVQPKTISEVLIVSLAQRLVRRICKHCKVEIEPDELAEDVFQHYGGSFPLYGGSGCDACHQSGYLRRIGLYELYVSRPEVAEAIGKGESSHRIRQRARNAGMRTLFEDGLIKVKAGVTSLNEIKRVVGYRAIRESLSDS